MKAHELPHLHHGQKGYMGLISEECQYLLETEGRSKMVLELAHTPVQANFKILSVCVLGFIVREKQISYIKFQSMALSMEVKHNVLGVLNKSYLES